ncbi:MAG: glucose-1-phosphate cytidylyltransferase [Acidobacteria bacterium]|nr:MAG: glucose-1-phosphate cytidylyltransferase [Acidobacteriota bacterium]
MKVAILAGGLGTRLAEETEIKPKPMVEIGGQPILWHIIKLYAHHGIRQFYIALGYRGEIIKRFFMDYNELNGNISIDLAQGQIERHERECEDWVVHLTNTGQNTNTGGRIKRLAAFLNDGTFMTTYGDGVCDVNLTDLLAFHRQQGCIGTVTAVRPPSRFGGLVFGNDSKVIDFTEKPQIGEGWINGGFMVFEPEIFNYLENDDTSLEAHALERLASEGQLAAYRHEGFWQCMDTLRDKRLLESLWNERRAPWKVWE